MTTILAIDPGSSQSAWLRFDGTRPGAFGITANEVLVRALRSGGLPDVVVIEKVESYGMAVGAEVFDTVFWAGRFAEAAGRVPVVLLPRRAVKLALCGAAPTAEAALGPVGRRLPAGPCSRSNAGHVTGRSDSRSGCEATDELVARDSPAGTGEDDATPVQHQHEVSEVEGEL